MVVFHNIVVFNVFAMVVFDRMNVGQTFERYCR